MKTAFTNLRANLFLPGIVWLFFSMGPAVQAQAVLDHYIEQGMENNIVLQQRNISLEKAMVALQIAGSYFSPQIGIQGNYTSGSGGRSISVPVGDLLNPVYRSLNQLTNTDQFPQIANVNQNFFPHNFYDAKVHTTVPIINSDLLFAHKVARQQIALSELDVAVYKRELVKNIKVAWLNYLGALETVKIFESAMVRGEEGKRVNESLLENGKGLPAYVLRSQSEIESIRAQLAEATRQIENAALYFNFLLNREPNGRILIDFDASSEYDRISLVVQDSVSVGDREELKMQRTAIDINNQLFTMTKLFWTPKINGFADLGSQAQDWKINSQARYYLVGLQLDVPIFGGLRNRSKIKSARLDVRSSQLGLSYSQRQLALGATMAHNAVLTARQNFGSASRQLEAARSYQRLIEKGYKQGINTFIEAVDARNQLTQAQLQVTLTRYRVFSAAAQLERETASWSFTSRN